MIVFRVPAAVLALWCQPAIATGQPLDLLPDPQDRQTAVVSVEATQRPPDPLDTRASVRFTNSAAGEVLRVLAAGAGLEVELPAAPLNPVTLTVSNVRLRVALDAICDTAACSWRLDGRTIKVSASAQAAASSLPPTVSVSLKDMSVADVFRALGDTLGVPVTIEGNVQRPPVSITFKAAETKTVLDFLCKAAGCTWAFDDAARVLRVRFLPG